MPTAKRVCIFIILAVTLLPPSFSFADVNLGEASRIPKDLPPPPPPHPGVPARQNLTITGGFSVNTDSREEVRDFYNGIFHTSDNVPMNSTADVPDCNPGANSELFVEAVLRRINWFRAMAGIPANVILEPDYNGGSQEVAVMISANHTLNHDPPDTFSCYSDYMHHFAGGNQAEGANGPDAVTDYIWDFGGNNNEVGHRRWILMPPTTTMGTGDVPSSGPDNTNAPANSIWVFDSSINNPRPVTRQPFVAWPPEGFVPFQVVYPYWSFALSNADFSAATVTMKSNGVPISVVIQPQQNGFGENTLVWVPMGLDASCECTAFPFNGSDTIYSVTVGNINANDGDAEVTNLVSFTYDVTVFDPSVPGVDFVAPAVNGPAQVPPNSSNIFSVTAINNPHATSYQWIVSQLLPGNLADDADNGLTNFTMSPTPDYPVVTGSPDGSGNCFHLCDDNGTSQILQLNETVYPTSNTTVSFESELEIATTDETARVQVSTNSGVSWQDLFTDAGCNSGNSGNQCETSFAPHTLSLGSFAGLGTLLRFDFSFFGGSFFPGVGQSSTQFGWCFEDVVITNALQLIGATTNILNVTNFPSGDFSDDASNGLVNFTFTPTASDYPVTTNGAPDGSGFCFHLCDDNGTSQILQLNHTLLPGANTTLSFASCLGISTSNESAHAQISTDGGTNWTDVFEQTGCNSGGQCETTFTPHTISLAAFAGKPALVRFDYQFFGGSFFPGIGQSVPAFGWCLENIAVSNSQQIVVSPVDTTNFTLMSGQSGTFLLSAVPVIFGAFPLDAGPAKQVAVVASSSGSIVMGIPVLSGANVLLNFSLNGVLNGTFKLLQANQLTGPWATNSSAVLSTNTPGISFRFTTTNGGAMRFYRVQMGE